MLLEIVKKYLRVLVLVVVGQLKIKIKNKLIKVKLRVGRWLKSNEYKLTFGKTKVTIVGCFGYTYMEIS